MALRLYMVLDDEHGEWIVKPGFKTLERLPAAIKIVDEHVFYTDEDTRSEFERLVRKLLVRSDSLTKYNSRRGLICEVCRQKP